MANGIIPMLANLNLNGNEIRNVKFEILAQDPASPKIARFWYNSAENAFKYFDGTQVVTLSQSALNSFVPKSSIGQANGVASLGADGKIPSTQLPSYVDDVVDAYIIAESTPLTAGWLTNEEGGTTPITPEADKIYVVVTDGEYINRTYRWSGSTYVEISGSQVYGAGNGINLDNGEFSIEVAANGANGLAVDSEGLKLNAATGSAAGAMSAADKTKLDAMPVMKTLTQQCGALTPAGGIATWTITHNFNTSNVIIQVFDATGCEVIVDKQIDGQNTVIINFVAEEDIAAEAYKATIIGFVAA